MDKNILKNNIISLSIIDVVGVMDKGVALLFNLVANEKDSYEVVFWYDPDGSIILEPEERLLKRLDVNDIKEYDKYTEMCFYFYSHIPNPDNILKEYLNGVTK